MDSKLTLTLYDVFGYLVPGFVVLLAASILESTFSGGWFLSLSLMAAHPIAFGVAAYFMGHACQAAAALLINRTPLSNVFRTNRYRLDATLEKASVDALASIYMPDVPNVAVLDNLSRYLLADAYGITSGVAADRDVMIAREGFFKQNMFAVAVLMLTMVAAGFKGGIRVQTHPGLIVPTSATVTFGTAVLALALMALFRERYFFFHRAKINQASLICLAQRAKDRLATATNG